MKKSVKLHTHAHTHTDTYRYAYHTYTHTSLKRLITLDITHTHTQHTHSYTHNTHTHTSCRLAQLTYVKTRTQCRLWHGSRSSVLQEPRSAEFWCGKHAWDSVAPLTETDFSVCRQHRRLADEYVLMTMAMHPPPGQLQDCNSVAVARNRFSDSGAHQLQQKNEEDLRPNEANGARGEQRQRARKSR